MMGCAVGSWLRQSAKVVVTENMGPTVGSPTPGITGCKGFALEVRRQRQGLRLCCNLEKTSKGLEVGSGPAIGARRTSCCPTHLANAIDADVTADPALVARGAIHNSIPQLLRIGLVVGSAVQLTGVL